MLKKISNCDYLIESTTGKTNRQLYILINLKCKPGTRFQDYSSDGESCLNNAPLLSCQHEAASYPVGENLELVDTNDMTTVQPARFR